MRKNRRAYLKPLILLGICLTPNIYLTAFAASQTTKADMVEMISQLDSILTTIDDAQKNQTPNERVQFHFSRFKGQDGQYHNGLREDITAMRNSIIDYLNHQGLEPANIRPLTTDFTSGQSDEQ